MIKEDYVSFELAKMLKEKGFDEACITFYYVNDSNKRVILLFQEDETAVNYMENSTCNEAEITAPTLQMAQKWFREEKHLAINPTTYYRKLEGHEFHNWGCDIVNLDTWELYCSNSLETFPADTYEEVLEKAMKYALEKFV